MYARKVEWTTEDINYTGDKTFMVGQVTYNTTNIEKLYTTDTDWKTHKGYPGTCSYRYIVI